MFVLKVAEPTMVEHLRVASALAAAAVATKAHQLRPRAPNTRETAVSRKPHLVWGFLR
jgi:hypothetical protein